MLTSTDQPRANGQKWVYTTLRIVDGDRQIKPSHVCGDYIRFPEPPRLGSSQIEIIITNGADVHRGIANVLPHSKDETKIPIQLVSRIS
jgi:hypothetical protein